MSDHIPDVTKMIGETPRTDAKRSGPNHFMGDWVNGNFAAQLERELNAANGNVERLTKANIQLREGAEELKQRIKRMEMAGDAMEKYCSDYYSCNKWYKAKEDKP